MKNCLMGNGSIEINLEIVYHSLSLVTKIKCVVSIKEIVIMNLPPSYPQSLERRAIDII